MLQEKHGDITLFRFETLVGHARLAHAVASCSYNYAPHRGAGREQAIPARQRVCELLGVSFDHLTSPAQVMAGEVLDVGSEDIGRGRDGRESAVPFVDGLICDRVDVPLILLSADCPLICVYDPDKPAIGAVHASWQGTCAHAATNLIAQMSRYFGSDPAKLQAGIAPCAGPCCYEVGDEVRRIAESKLDNAEQCLIQRNGRWMFDLWAANRHQLSQAGLVPDRIEQAGICSICDDRFFSHRRQGVDAGRTALFIALRA